MRLTFRFGLLSSLLLFSLAAAASPWISQGFDGRGFAKGSGSAAIMTRDGYLPVPAGAAAPHEDQLPAGTGALAVFCYQQRSGGKLRQQTPFVPLTGVVVTVTGNSLTLAARTDIAGYLVLALPPGTYQVHVAGFSKGVSVEKGKTSLVAFRGGKRMVD